MLERKRREFIALLGGVAASSVSWSVAARAQPSERAVLVGVLIAVADDPEGQARLGAFRDGMRDLGWIDGSNMRMEVRFAAGSVGKANEHAQELVGLAPAVLIANSSPAVAALQQRTRTIPIVFAQVVDPVSAGFVDNLARPGGNITGLVSLDYALGAKWLEMLKEIAPRVSGVGVLRDPTTSGAAGQLGAIQGAARTQRLELTTLDVREPALIERGMALLARGPNSGLIVLANPTATVHLNLIVELAARHRIPAIYPYRYFARAGGLISYGADNLDLYRRAAGYVDRILKGAKPADLPVQNPTKFELAINLRTAKALGLDVPTTLFVRADEVIE
jgi:putative tryptophan/tyrosine transport system substrate-binding protein